MREKKNISSVTSTIVKMHHSFKTLFFMKNRMCPLNSPNLSQPLTATLFLYLESGRHIACLFVADIFFT